MSLDGLLLDGVLSVRDVLRLRLLGLLRDSPEHILQHVQQTTIRSRDFVIHFTSVVGKWLRFTDFIGRLFLDAFSSSNLFSVFVSYFSVYLLLFQPKEPNLYRPFEPSLYLLRKYRNNIYSGICGGIVV